MLCGGMMSGDIIEIAGASGTGKTQLLFFIAASVACGSEATVLYVDSKNAFSPRRIVEMYNEGDTFANVRSSGTSHEQILERIRVVDCCTYEDMFKLLDELREKLDTKPDWFWDDLRLIVIDSLGGIFAPINGQSDGQGNFIISEITRSLVSLSANHHLPFLVTNYAVSNKPYGGGNTRGTSHHPRFLSNDQMRRHKPSLGQSWRFLPTIQLFLSMYKEEEESLLVGGGSWAAAVEDADENDEDDGTNKAATGLISSALRSGESASVVVEPMVYTTLKGRTYRLARRKLEVLGSHRTPIGHSCDVHIGGPDVY
ncbi:P-loop containing nucleoside triphosphate hydrolase protein [Cladochytrium replicatum]|nr:P-loop containing nucleoside triphosphate hydrolase protein [Cladochytrium replicatum]